MSNASLARRGSRLRIPTNGPSDERATETLALGIGTVAFVLVALVALPVFRLQPAPIAGPNSAGQYSAIAGAIAAIVAFLAGRYLVRRPEAPVTWTRVLDVCALAFAHGVIALLSWTLLAVIFEQGFIGAEVFAIPLLALSGAIAAISAYIAFLSATHMDLSLLAIVLAVFLVQGVLASTLTASDPQWWEMNLSALGMTDDLSAFAFNLTLIVAGVLVTTLARYATAGMATANASGARSLRTCLIVIGVFLACVGIFKVDEFFWVHNSVAIGMVVAFAVAAVRITRWVPGLPQGFVLLGRLFIAIIVVLAVFFFTGYYTLTAVELVAGVLVFSWIILLLRGAAALQTDAADGALASPPPGR